MARITFEEASEELDFETFLDSESLEYKTGNGASGMQFNIKCCPDCGDDKWKTYIGVDTGLGNCFKCNKGYNSLTFIRSHLGNVGWGETMNFVADILKDQGWQAKRKTVVATTQGKVVLPISMELPTPDGENLKYLEDRGFDADISKYFSLRYCQFGWWAYVDHEGKKQTQNFSNRVIIPVYDLDGELKTFQGRDLSETSTRKYLFPTSLPGTGRYILNGQNVMATDSACMGEGAFDVAAIKVAFDEDPTLRHVAPIGSFGKHMSYGSETGDDQLGRLNILKRAGLKYLTIMWDGEKAALIAALNAGKMLNGIGIIAKIALLPAGKDPNEVSTDVIRAAYNAAEKWTPAIDVKWRLRNPYRAS